MSKESVARKSFLPKTLRMPELGKPSMGVALVIVGIDPSKNGENVSNPNIWTTIELKSKPATDRVSSQISIPADTRKIRERREFNVLGSLAEFSRDNNLIRSLSFVSSSFVPGAIEIKGNRYDLGILFLDGLPSTPIIPLDSDEVAANGWVELKDLRNIRSSNPSSLRSFVGQLIEAESEKEGAIRTAIVDYFDNPDKRISLSTVLPSDFSIENFYQYREKRRDVISKSGVIFPAC